MKGGDGERACLLLCSGTEALHVSMYRCALTSQEDGALSSVYLDPAIRCHVRRLILGATKWVDSVDSANKTDTAPLNMPQVKEMLSDGFPPKLGPQFQQCLIARQGPQRLVFLGGKGLKRELGIRAAPQGEGLVRGSVSVQKGREGCWPTRVPFVIMVSQLDFVCQEAATAFATKKRHDAVASQGGESTHGSGPTP